MGTREKARPISTPDTSTLRIDMVGSALSVSLASPVVFHVNQPRTTVIWLSVFYSVGFKGNLSLLEICFPITTGTIYIYCFCRALKQMED